MRALYLVLLITLCLPLQAGDPADLNSAVEMFRSPRPAVRAEGSKIADKELRRLLGPFMKALQDPDPEVRRRVSESILALVPFHDREPETQTQHVNRLVLAQAQALKVFRLGVLKQRIVRIPQFQPHQQKKLLDALQRQVVIQNKKLRKAASVVGKFGVTGSFIQVANAIRGLRVNQVAKGSAAEQAGIVKGDTILSVNGTVFANYEVFLTLLDGRRGWSGAKLKVMRGARIFEITVK
jgi:hypothetical protein